MRPFKNTKHTLCITAAVALAASTAYAQVPTSVDPSKVEQRFQERVRTPSATPSVAPEVPTAAPKLKNASQRFTLKAVAIDGATVYSENELAPLFAEALGKQITLGEAQSLAEKITLKYRNDGYILSQAVIPQQSVSNGTLHVRVIEGYISNVVIEGDVRDSRATRLVDQYGKAITQARPLNIATLERYLLLMDDLPGATAKGVVKPSAKTFGAADLVVNVTHKAFEGSLSVDNRGTRFIGPYQITATGAANSLFNIYDRSLVRIITTSDTDELKFIDFQHEEQIANEGTRGVLTGSWSKTQPGHTLEVLDIEGISHSLQAKVVHPFKRSRAENLVGRVLFDYRNTDTDLADLKFSNDRLRVLRAGMAYDFADRFQGVDLFDFQVSRGMNIFNASEDGVARSRADGMSDFGKVNLDITRTQSLPAGFSVLTSFSSQYSFQKLLASEQFSIGGAGFGGAYDPAELSGDHGVAGKAELRYGQALPYNWLNSYQAFAYYDIGQVWTKGGTGDNNSLASAGLGVRANFNQWLSGTAEVGFPLTKEVSIENDKDPRFFFSVTGRF